ncbi:MAG: hypothetical protein M5U12_21970 [Verrucomicrobia bacterium]|nr:hypothetical protein [Verrucomicrobiota bacterium]
MRLPAWIRDLPLRRKVTLLLLAPCLVGLLIASAVLLGLQVRMFRQEVARSMAAVAEILGANLSAAIAINDPKAAAELLDSLQVRGHMVSGALVLPDGTVFAQYGQPVGGLGFEREPRFEFREREASWAEPVMLGGRWWPRCTW